MSNPVDNWRELASRLGLEVIAPAIVSVGERSTTFAALLPQIGAKNGMIVDPEWEAIGPHADALSRLGYAYSAVDIGTDFDAESAKEMLRDWGWSADEPKPSWW
jgi:hypothetical protein